MFRATLTRFFATHALALVILGTGATAAAGETPAFLRGSEFDVQAQRTGIEALLLYSIAVTESGASVGHGFVAPSPYAIRVNESDLNQAYYPATRAEAEKILSDLLHAGRSNIDVGLMQVNLRWHGDRVQKPLALLDPTTNLRIGADILYDTMLSSPGDIVTAIGRYHSWTADRGRLYAERVIRLYKTIKTQKGA